MLRKSFFAWLPIETLIHENQNEYYSVINASNNSGESTIFVEFMLRIIKKKLWKKSLKIRMRIDMSVIMSV